MLIMFTKTLLYIILITVIALLLALFQYLYKSKKSKLNLFLAFLRFLSLFLILLIILNPSIEKEKLETLKPNLLVAIDQSSSVKYSNQEDYIASVIEKIKNNSKLNNKFSLNYYGFGKEVSLLDSLSFDKSQTDLARPLQEFSKIYKNKNTPVILISDGNQTTGKSVEFVNYKSPVYPLIVGDTTKLEDVFIAQINLNKHTYINNKLPVEIFVNYEGAQNIEKKLSIYYEGKKVYSKKLNFNKLNSVETVSFHLTSAKKGTQFYTAKIEALNNEFNTKNNSKSFSIDVIEEKMKILMLSSIIHPDMGMLKKAIESNNQREVTIDLVNGFKGNVSDYQLIILYQPTNSFEKVMKEISTKNRNYFVITGLSTDWNFLNKIQSFFTKKEVLNSELYSATFNPDYTGYISEDIGFFNFSPLEDKFGEVSFEVIQNPILFQKIGNIELKKPLLSTFYTGNQKFGVLFGENSWRWRMQSYLEHKSFDVFDNFISNLILYLASNKNKNRLQVNLKSVYFANETINVSAIYTDDNLNFDNRVKIGITISNDDTNMVQEIPLSSHKNNYFAEIFNLKPGDYKYIISVQNQSIKKYGSFKILPFEVEQQFSNSNDSKLKIVASNTNGKIYYSNQEDIMLNNILSNTNFKTIQKTVMEKTPLINWKWLLGFVLFFLSLEWFTRKYFGKI